SEAGAYRYIPQADASGVVDLVYVVEDTGGLQSVARARIDYGEAAVSENEIHVEHAIIESSETDVYRDLGLLEAVDMSAASLAHDDTSASTREGGDAHAEQAANTTKTAVSEATIGAEPKEKLAQRFEDGLEDEVYRLNAADLAGAGSMLSIKVADPDQGALEWDRTSGTIVFTPTADFNGEARLQYEVSEAGEVRTERAGVVFAPVNDTITLTDHDYREQRFNLFEDEVKLFTREALIGSKYDADGEELHITRASMDASQGKVSVMAGGDLRFEPAKDYIGDATFEIEVSDGVKAVSAQYAVRLWALNDAPDVHDDHTTMLEDSGIMISAADLLKNDVDDEGDALRMIGVWDRSTGTASYDAINDTILFKPEADEYGPAWIDTVVEDEVGGWSVSRVQVDITNVNDSPRATDDVLLAWSSGPDGYVNSVMGNWLTSNDVEVDGEQIFVDAIEVWSGPGDQGPHGTVTLDVSQDLIGYRAPDGFSGEDYFRYRVSDGHVDSEDWADVRVQVVENQAPVSFDFVTEAVEDTVLVFGWEDFAPHVTDADLRGLLPEEHRIIEVGNAVHGEVQLNADGSVSFTPSAHYNAVQHGGVASFDYMVADIVGNLSSASASIVYTPVNDAPTGHPEEIIGAREDDAEFIFKASQLLDGDYDVDGDAVSFVGITSVQNGSIWVDESGYAHYSTASNFNGLDALSYQITDGVLVSDAISYIKVESVNDLPVVQYDRGSGDDSGNNHYSATSLLSNDYDADGDVLSITSVSGKGASLSSSGGINFKGSEGDHVVYYTVSDGQGAVESRLDLDIDHVNRAPEWHPFIYDRNGQKLHMNAWDEEEETERLNYFITPSNISAPVGVSISVEGPGWNGYSHDFHFRASWDGEQNRTVTIDVRASVVDSEGAISSQGTTIEVTAIGDWNSSNEGKPIVFDLNNDGLYLTALQENSARFDWDGDDVRDRTGWIAGQGDGLLAYDHNEDGIIERADEISFVDYLEGARTDLEGLRAFDSDADGMFTASDAKWERFGVWIDDGDALSEAGEFLTLDTIGMTAIELTSDGLSYVINGNQVFGEAAYTLTDGTSGMLGDVAFAAELGQSVEEEMTQALGVDPEISRASLGDAEFELSKYGLSEELVIVSETAHTQADELGDFSLDFGLAISEDFEAATLGAWEVISGGLPYYAEAGDDEPALATQGNAEVYGHTPGYNRTADTGDAGIVESDDSEPLEPLVPFEESGLPSDNELDRLALAANHLIAAQPALTPIAPLEIITDMPA
ncbi:MAG: tandem-95 repeat protein, partial [Propionibacteriaceae bacterium]|nr:tandem-95 repeat protein [Propionibacteriaceae bacterium]